jgi:cyclophilin family peptidyl-prolyl cis-trans isomerase
LDGSSPRTTHFAQAPPACIDPGKKWTATFDTTEGKIVVDLDTTRTAGTANNFVVLALYHYYDQTSFDRIDTSIDIIQGGSPDTQSISDPGPGYTINDEGGTFSQGSGGNLTGPFTSYNPGDLVMARGSAAHSAAAQYFFVAGPKANELANGGGPYVTFGHVSQGLDVLQKVEGLYEPCGASQSTCLGGAPSRVVLVNSVTITSS